MNKKQLNYSPKWYETEKTIMIDLSKKNQYDFIKHKRICIFPNEKKSKLTLIFTYYGEL